MQRIQSCKPETNRISMVQNISSTLWLKYVIGKKVKGKVLPITGHEGPEGE